MTRASLPPPGPLSALRVAAPSSRTLRAPVTWPLPSSQPHCSSCYPLETQAFDSIPLFCFIPTQTVTRDLDYARPGA